jgi:tRNA-intron endonuclease
MDATLDGDVVRAGRRAREQFYDARGYGRPDGDALVLAPVEAAHLLYRGDLDAVDGMDFRAFLSSAACPDLDFLVYADLRERGFYLSPARAEWVADPTGADFVVYPRGTGPWDDAVEYRIRVVSERATVPAAALGDVVLAVVDEESEITYLETDAIDVAGETADATAGDVPADLLADRALVWDPPAALYDSQFYGQPLGQRGEDEGIGILQLSLVEAAHLARRGVLDVTGSESDAGHGSGRGTDDGAVSDAGHASGTDDGAASGPGDPSGVAAVIDRGRAVEGDRFDRRLAVYEALRERGVVPKTGYKFGADFRTYADVDSVDSLGHSELLVRVLPPDHAFAPRDLALDVRLAGGVRKRMVFALTGADGDSEWLTVARLTP